jgi:hypothetical protein
LHSQTKSSYKTNFYKNKKQATSADIRRHSEEREVGELESQALLEGQR